MNKHNHVKPIDKWACPVCYALRDYVPDPDMIDDWLHPARAATGVLRGMVTGALFWGTLIGIVALANKFIGGG